MNMGFPLIWMLNYYFEWQLYQMLYVFTLYKIVYLRQLLVVCGSCYYITAHI